LTSPQEPGARSVRAQATPIILGTVVAQGVGVALLPVVIRVVDPAPFAHYSSILAAAMVVGSVASFRLEALLPQLDASVRSSVQRTALALTACVAIAATALLFVGASILSTGFGGYEAVGFGAIAGITGVIGIRTYAAIGRGDGRRPGAAKVAQALTLPALQIGLVLGGLRQLVGLLLAEVMSRLAAERTLVFRVGLRERSTPRPPRLAEVRNTLREHRAHVLAFAPATLVNLGASQLPLIIAPGVLTSDSAGVYAFAHRLILIPSTLVSQGLGQAFHHRFGRAVVGDEAATLGDEARRLHLRLAVVVGVLFAAVAVAAPVVFPLIAPPQWVPAGIVVSLLAIWASALTVASPFSSLLIVSGRQVESLVLNVVDLLAKGAVSLIILAAPRADEVTFAVAVSSVTTLVAICSSFRFLAAAGCSAREVLPGVVIAVGLPLLAVSAVVLTGFPT
jgi:O-antigen/teichoic acid export membrane protein